MVAVGDTVRAAIPGSIQFGGVDQWVVVKVRPAIPPNPELVVIGKPGDPRDLLMVPVYEVEVV